MSFEPQCGSNIRTHGRVKFWSKTPQLHYIGRHPSAAGFDTWPHEKTLLTPGDNEAEKGFLQTCTQ